jgi:hypothetical protein
MEFAVKLYVLLYIFADHSQVIQVSPVCEPRVLRH